MTRNRFGWALLAAVLSFIPGLSTGQLACPSSGVTFSVTGPAPVPAELVGLAPTRGVDGVGFNSLLEAPLRISPGIDSVDDACAALPAGIFAGAIALVRRGVCSFTTKVNNASAAGAIAVIIANTNSGQLSALVPGTTIPAFTVTQPEGNALRDFGQTNPGTATARLISCTDVFPPDPPSGVSVSALAGTATVSFTAPASNGGAAITSYTVTCTSSDGGAAGTTTGTSSPIAVTGLTVGETYTCAVTATNGAGTGSASAGVTPFVMQAPQPIPTLSEWVMTLLAGLIGIATFGSLRRRVF